MNWAVTAMRKALVTTDSWEITDRMPNHAPRNKKNVHVIFTTTSNIMDHTHSHLPTTPTYLPQTTPTTNTHLYHQLVQPQGA